MRICLPVFAERFRQVESTVVSWLWWYLLGTGSGLSKLIPSLVDSCDQFHDPICTQAQGDVEGVPQFVFGTGDLSADNKADASQARQRSDPQQNNNGRACLLLTLRPTTAT